MVSKSGTPFGRPDIVGKIKILVPAFFGCVSRFHLHAAGDTPIARRPQRIQGWLFSLNFQEQVRPSLVPVLSLFYPASCDPGADRERFESSMFKTKSGS